MKSVKTPPPTLLRARFATVPDHLPSVPSVVLPNQSPTEKVGLSCFKPDKYWSFVSIQFESISLYLPGSAVFILTELTYAATENDKNRQYWYDKFCAERMGHFSPRRNFGQDERNCGFRIAECGSVGKTRADGNFLIFVVGTLPYGRVSDRKVSTRVIC